MEVEVTGIEEAKRVVGRLLEKEIPKTLHLRSKWSLIATQLALLRSNLDSVDPLSPNLNLLGLPSIAATLSHTLTLSHSFQSPSLPHGKLLSQSLLHSALSSLRLHVSDSLLLLDSGLLSPNSPSPSPDRDAVLTLIARLQIGIPPSRSFAMDSLLRLLHDQPKNVLLVISQGIIPVLLTLLDNSPSDDMKDKILAAISRISAFDSGKHALDAEGLPLLNHLLRAVEAGSGFAQIEACAALQALTLSRENSRAIAARGGISSLLEICATGMSSIQASATRVLSNLAAFPEVKAKFVDESGISVLFAVLSCGTAAAREDTIRCLCNLVRDDDILKLELVQGRVIPRLKNYWESVPSDASLQAAAEFLSELASCQPIGEAILADGFFEKLMSLLSSEVSGVRTAAAVAIHKLSRCMKSTEETGIGGGCIPALIGMLDGKSMAEREAAAMALSSLVVNKGNRRAFCRDSRGGVARTVRLLDPSRGEKLDRRYPVSVLASLVNNKKWRRLMVTEGACAYLEKLGRMDVEGARKLYETILPRGKVWGILPHQGQS
ncbi:hypothetical protein MLD38_012593 [Melastoma candidum]|nr:hypothetical protein MLD38_012593 [Melastoma candidum]